MHRIALIPFFALAVLAPMACGGTDSKGGTVETTVTTAPTTVTTAALSFSSCADAAGAGYHDMKRGEAGYSTRLDGDGDGVACDAAKKMTFAECQKSAEYPGGKYAVDFDNGVCKVQKP